MIYTTSFIYKKALHAHEFKWNQPLASNLYVSDYALETFMESDFLEFQLFLTRFQRMKEIKEIANVGIYGLHLLAKLNQRLIALHSWKLTHPNTKVEGSFYDSLVRFNYNEHYTVIEYIAKINELSLILLENRNLFETHLEKLKCLEFQDFLVNFIENYSFILTKKQKYSARWVLLYRLQV